MNEYFYKVKSFDGLKIYSGIIKDSWASPAYESLKNKMDELLGSQKWEVMLFNKV